MSSIWDYVPVTRAEIRAIVQDEVNKVLLSAIQNATQNKFNSLNSHIEAVEETVTILGEKLSEATDLLDAIDSRTNDLATEVANLIVEVQNAPDANPAIVARLQALKANLDAIAADPNNPVPDPVPAPDDGGE
jgi:chromosome segregation ATPase